MERRTFIGRLLLALLAVLGFLNMKSAFQPKGKVPRGLVTVSGGKLTPESEARFIKFAKELERKYKWTTKGSKNGQPLLVLEARPRGVPG